MGWKEAWITSAEDDAEGKRAMRLAKSLRRTHTAKKILVVPGPSVSYKMMALLMGEFDGIAPLDVSKIFGRQGGVGFEAAVKATLHASRLVTRGIFVSSSLLVLENVDFFFDVIFDAETSSPSGEVDFGESETIDLTSPIFAVKPSTQNLGLLNQFFIQNNQPVLTAPVLTEFQVLQRRATRLFSFCGVDFAAEKQNDVDRETSSLDGVGRVRLVRLVEDADGGTSSRRTENWGNLEQVVAEVLEEGARGQEAEGEERVPLERMEEEPIAIVGMACRFPGANGVEEFWRLLVENGDAITTVPEWRWPEEQVKEVTAEHRKSKAGFLKCPVDEFDGKFFGMSPKELEFTDPQQRLLLEVSWEALEDAAVDAASLKGTQTGIFTGTWTHHYEDLMNQIGFAEEEFFRTYMGNAYGATAGRMAHFYGTTGANIATESGCSSSMVAVGLACNSLRRKKTSMALACGVNLLVAPFEHKDMEAFCAEDGHCKTFDAAADGFGRAEGVGVLVLKRLADAVAAGDVVRAVIRGYGEAQEGPSRSLGTPTVDVEALAMRLALEEAQVLPWEVSFVEAHGTGTPVGDPMEMEAIAKVYARGRKAPLLVTSVKTNVGHTESCSGIAGIIKTVLSLEREVIAPHRALTNLNPKIDLSKTPAAIPLVPTPWPHTPLQPRIAGVSSFGITGTDTHVILQEAPKVTRRQVTGVNLPFLPLAISARSEAAATQLLQNYADYLRSNPTRWEDVTFTANTGRTHFREYRATVVASDAPEFLRQVERQSVKILKCRQTSERQKVVFLFTGQGSQYAGMARELFDVSPDFQLLFNKCDVLLRERFGVDVKRALWEDANLLQQTLYSQTAIFVVDFCLAELWKSWGVSPDVVVGHSLGEYAAAAVAGILSFDDALTLVAERSRLIDNLPRGKMIVVNADVDVVQELIKKSGVSLEVAAMNTPDQTTLAGKEDSILALKKFCDNNGVKSHVLDASHAFHSEMMDAALPALRKVAQNVNYKRPTCKFISGMEGREVMSVDAEYWVRHTRLPVNFIDACDALREDDGIMCVEVGPQPILSTFVSRNLDANESKLTLLPSLRKKQSDWRTLMDSLGRLYATGMDVNWAAVMRHAGASKMVGLPTYPFQRKKFWFEKPKNEGLLFGGKQLHPLVNFRFPSAAVTKTFQTRLSLQKEMYVNDHVVGRHVIFPGAGYVEMILAAGHSASLAEFEDFRHPRQPLFLRELVVDAPMALTEKEDVNLQTVVAPAELSAASSADESNWSVVSVHRQQEDASGTKSWVRHSSAKFSSFSNDTSAFLDSPESIDVDHMKSLFAVGEEMSDVYAALRDVGLLFGETFRSIRRVWKREIEKLAEIVVPPSSAFLAHPVAIDAMIQALMGAKQKVTQLMVPVKIDNFVWFGSSGESSHLFVHVNKDATVVTLFDESGRRLAAMAGVTLVPTSTSAVENALEAQKLVLPTLLEEEWIPGNVSAAGDSEVEKDFFLSNSYTKFSEWEGSLPKQQMDEKLETQLVDEMCALQGLQSFLELGWLPKKGEVIRIEEFVENFKIAPKMKLFTRRLFEILAKHTKYVEGSDMTFRIPGTLPTTEEIARRISEIDRSLRILRTEFDGVRSVAEKSAGVLRGEDSVLPVLFGEGNVAQKAYTDFVSTIQGNQFLVEAITCVAEDVASRKGKLRILEVGGGTGGSTRSILPALTKSGVDFSYTFTDISAGFFLKAEEGFSEWRESMTFKAFDVEKDPKTQGFVHEEFDVVVATHVLHATRNMRQTMANVRHLLRPNGLALLVEAYEPLEVIDLIFGLVDGYWLFQDFDLRPYHCIVPETSWPQLLTSSGFPTHKMLKVPASNSGLIVAQATSTCVEYSLPSFQATWIVVRGSPGDHFALEVSSQLGRQGRRVALVEDVSDVLGKLESTNENGHVEGVVFVSEGKSFDAEEPTKNFLLLLQTLISTKISTISTISTPLKLVVVTKGAVVVGDQSLGFPHSSPLWGMSRTYRSEFPNLSCVNVDVDPHDTPQKNAVSLLRALWTQKDEMLAVRNGNFFTLRLKKWKVRNNALSLSSNSPRFELIFPATNAIADLRFRVSKNREVEGSCVEIECRAAALNFRDLFSVIKPSKEFEKNAAVGTDLAGVVSAVGPDVKNLKVGDAVIGAFFEFGGLPSHVVVPEESVVRLPQNFTLADGSTLPAVFTTAYLCLIDVAKLKKGETVLIHTASGGVGIAAIQVARDVGARIIATAGSRRKRAFLREVMGVEEVFHSRDVSFTEEILRVTEGRGVDVVLNSLTGPGFKEATLDATAKNGRFVEMSKLNVWSVDEVKDLRPDVDYQIVDLTSVSNETWRHLLFHLEEYLSKGKLLPLPYEAFEAVEIRSALTHLQKARHIGKIVVRLPSTVDRSDVGGGRRQLLFNERSSYLITGGLGGIGLEAAKWMANEGAKFLVLCGRRPPNDNATRVIADLNAIGKVVVAMQVDVGKWEDCKNLVERINGGELRLEGTSFPPLRGIQHAAGCLSDGMLLNQTWPKFQVTFNAKVNGAWHLHKLTQHAAFPLEHFVMYSSVAATFGAMGQSNHAAANTFLDALTHFRKARGLPATSVNWGQWGKIGVAADLDLSFCTPFTPLQGFSSLKEILRSHKPQVGVIEADLSKFHLAFPWALSRYAKDVFDSASTTAVEKQISFSLTSEDFWKEIDAALRKPKETEDVIRKVVVQIVSLILKMDDNDTIDVHQNFQEMGLDSLMMVELKNVLQGILGAKVALTANLLADANSVARLSQKLRQLILEDGSDVKSPEEMAEFILTQATLPDDTKPEENEKLNLSGELTFLVAGNVDSQFVACVVENLTQRQNVKKVVVLTSSNRKAAFVKQLSGQELNVIVSKVEVVLIADDASSLTATLPAYDRLASEVDVIVDCRLTSSNEETVSQIRKEAEETQNVLKFACEKKLKFVCHVNRLLPQRKATEERVLEETLPECSSDVLKEYGDCGYPSTQFVSECLLKSAVERGVPCRVFRLPHLSGDSRSGRFQLEEGHIFLRYLEFITVGKIPAVPVPFAVVPVNQAASLIVDVLLDKPNFGKTVVAFNVTNPHEYSFSDFFEVSAELGKPVRAVELEEFMSEENSVLKSIKYAYGDPLDFSKKDSAYSKLSKTSALIPFANLRGVVGDLEAQVETPLQILRRDLTFAQNSGLFEKFTIPEEPTA